MSEVVHVSVDRLESGLNAFPKFTPDNGIRLVLNFGEQWSSILVVTLDDRVWGCGGCFMEELGWNGNWREIRQLSNVKVKKIVSGSNFCVAQSEGGKLYSWGHNDHAQLGRGETDSLFEPSPCLIPLPNKIKDVVCGSHHTLALNDIGEIFAWGCNVSGQIGRDPATLTRILPIMHNDQYYEYIYCSPEASFAISELHELFCWGSNANGELGLGHREPVIEPTPNLKFNGMEGIKKIVRGHSNILCLLHGGSLYDLGDNFDTKSASSPKLLCGGVTDIYSVGETLAFKDLRGQIHLRGKFRGVYSFDFCLTPFSCFSEIVDEYENRTGSRLLIGEKVAEGGSARASPELFQLKYLKLPIGERCESVFSRAMETCFRGLYDQYKEFYSFQEFLYSGHAELNEISSLKILETAFKLDVNFLDDDNTHGEQSETSINNYIFIRDAAIENKNVNLTKICVKKLK